MFEGLRELGERASGFSLWKRGLLWLTALAMLMSAGGFLFAWLGLAPIAASSGHWPVTDWFLHFAMRNAVELRAVGTNKPPPLDNPALILKGAGHYASGCAPCHGAPGEERPLIAQQMTPAPPFLPPKISQWKPRELFWIVKHGVKFTAMPAWPALQRDDEVWAMVAFLQTLPELDRSGYRELAYGPSAAMARAGQPMPRSGALDALLADCARCHGEGGKGRGSAAFPLLAGQREAYLFASLRAFALGKRYSGIMGAVASNLEPRQMAALARHYANRAAPKQTAASLRSTEAVKRGRRLAQHGAPRQGIPSCRDCHGPGPGARNAYYPQLAGQYEDYLFLQLNLFRSGQRGGTPYAQIMTTVASTLSEEQMRDLAAYYASL